MEIIFLLAGLLLLLLALFDFAKNTLLPSGQGPATALINHYLFRLIFKLSRGDGRHHLLIYAGTCIILSIFAFWVFALWLGVLLIFLSDAYSVLDSVDKSPADFFEKMYYTGFKLSTLGVGDFVAGRNGWRVLTALTAFMDLFTITLSISYLVPVISNAGQKRSLARYMRSLGNFPQDIVINSFNGQDFKGYESQFAELSTMIFSYTQNMLTYPILHHMHNTDPHENIVTRMCCLDEALNIFIFHLPKARRPSPQGLKVLRSAVTSYLRSVSYLEKEVQTPPLPQISAVSRESGIGLENQSPEQLNDFYQQLERRRRLWQANLQSDGWTWQDVEIAPEKQHLDLSTQKLAQYA